MSASHEKYPIYLDNHATTRVDERVMSAMVPYFLEQYGNAASRQHAFGWAAEAAVEKARQDIALLLGAEANEVIFTSGATEANNLALKGLVEAYAPAKSHLITVATEHPSVLDTCARLEEYGCTVTRLPVDEQGLVDPEAVRRAITPQTLVVSVMYANNEIGTLAPMAEVGSVCREAGVFFHTDATQAIPFLPINVQARGIDLLSLSGHKCHAPKGIGALCVRNGITIAPQMDGGGHERGKRSGTLNVPGIVGLGVAAGILRQDQGETALRVRGLRDRLELLLRDSCGEIVINGHPESRLPNNLSVTFPGVRADRLLLEVRSVAMSTGSACSSATPEPSHVLRAIGLGRDALSSTIRIGLSRFTTDDEITEAARLLAETVQRIRQRHGAALSHAT